MPLPYGIDHAAALMGLSAVFFNTYQFASSLNIWPQKNELLHRQEISTATDELFSAIKEVNNLKLNTALRKLEMYAVNPMTLRDAENRDPLVALAQEYKKEIQREQSKKRKCELRGQYGKLMHLEGVGKALIFARWNCNKPNDYIVGKFTQYRFCFEQLLPLKYVDFKDYKLKLNDALAIVGINSNDFTDDQLKPYLDVLILGDDEKLAEFLISKLNIQRKTTPRP